MSRIPKGTAAKAWRTLAAALVVAVVAGTGYFVTVATPAGTSLAAKQLCSLVFVSGLPARQAVDQYINPLIGPLPPFLRWSVDPARKQTQASALGFAEARAVAHPGYGCVQLIHRTEAELAGTLPAQYLSRSTQGASAHGAGPLQRALAQALQASHTQAVLVARNGHVVAEAYAPGIGAHTPLPGWSMAKSLTATIAGIMVHDGSLSTDEVALFRMWEEDDRAHIRIDDLLRMTSGIDIAETTTGADANSHMLFKAGDAAAFAISRGLSAAPGSAFAYTSGSTVLAAAVITDRLGGPQATYRYIRERLFEPLGMQDTVLEPDESGTFIGSSFVMASARDWAKLGQLYLQRGNWNGVQVFSPDWVEYVTTHTPASSERAYGAGFWLSRPADAGRAEATWPEDTFYASGLQNNRLLIVPSRGLVVVRLGATNHFDDSGIEALMHAALAEFPTQP
jgi:CubicO group peptidase (beta-lactamase class C family)